MSSSPTDPSPQAPAPADPTTFADLDLRPELVAALASLGYEEPTPIQREAIPAMLSGRDVLGQAATGTGKTAAFALPLLQTLTLGRRAPQALVLAPTRELAMQVSEAVHRYGRDLGARVLPVYGGQPIGRQLKVLERGVDVVVATPGRAKDLIERGSLVLDEIRTVVLDEADEMLDMGFADDLEAILGAAPKERQTVLFSATMPSRVNHMVRKHLTDPVRILIARDVASAGEAPKVRQTAYVVARHHKAAALGRVLDIEAPVATIVFCRTREDVDGLTETLNGRGYRAEALHGGLSQEQRDRVMGRLRSGTAELLVATDVAARGLDLDQLTHVVNFDVPNAAESYVHRIGRVGRAGREGVAVTLAEPRERRMLLTIERTTGQKISIEPVPTVEDLRSKRLDQTTAALREALSSGDLEQVSAVVDALSADHGLREIALAAVRLLHDASGPADEHEIPEAPKGAPASAAPARAGARPLGRSGDSRAESRPETRGARASGVHRTTGEPMAKLFIGIGRNAGMRPQDVVGAVAGETRLSGKDVGVIEILERFTLVEVPEAAADEVVEALRGTMIRGGTPTVRRDGKR